MISKQIAKFLKSLQIKKFRKEHACFIVEGEKSVNELLGTDWVVREIYATEQYLQKHKLKWIKSRLIQVSEADLNAVSSLKNNTSALAVVEMKQDVFYPLPHNELSLALDAVNDPGNLGTIIRIADWYGIKQIYCSLDTVDNYNPKVISATKGSFSRVNVFYVDLKELIRVSPVPVLGAFLIGTPIHHYKQDEKGGLLVMGSEANGISTEVEKLIPQRITIPAYGSAESLNVGVATAIICDNLKRMGY